MKRLSPLLLPFWGGLFIFIKLFGLLPYASWWWLLWFFLTDQSIFYYIHKSLKTDKVEIKNGKQTDQVSE